jgi:putative ABC transport system permease protein
MNVASELREGLKISLGAIWANKLRAVLTTLGIVIGILTVSLMAMAIQGLNLSFMRSISVLGADVFYIEKFPWETRDAWWKYRGRRDLELKDARAIMRESTHALAVSVETAWMWPVKSKHASSTAIRIVGNTEQSAMIRQTAVKEGRFLSRQEADGGRPVCVLGADVAEKMFPNESAVGQKIKIGNGNFEVIGVNERFGAFIFGNIDNEVIIPLSRLIADFSRKPYLWITVKIRDAALMEEAREEIRGILRKSRRVAPGADDDFAVNQQEVIINTFRRVGGTIASVGLFITGLSLFVGGIGIMNIMFVSVAERTREIGIRKAIGAKRRTILIQFLIEAAIVCLFGGLIGLAIAFAASFAVKQILPTAISPAVVGLAMGMALLTGLIAGFMPAWRAARMNPVDALRAE